MEKMKYEHARIYRVYIKSLDQIKEVGGVPKPADNRKKRSYNIVHSSGGGGGLTVPCKFIDEHFGSNRLINVRFTSTGAGRNIFEVFSESRLQGWPQQVYEEWLIFEIKNHLPEDLFEI